ncbi:hypothetical protein EDD18DRAFT_1151691 [Armillaria luteobubalina]|uniref:Uncharacterized protein n=1 Tax=Armillaria luteobubalina TaxID=153913 RepID=A0AA39QBR6_9AGAR|nr:hypothetical protein EDD18DRAFT_1151691 [Armillaria luteobubalina]
MALTSDHATFIGFGVDAILYGINTVLVFTALAVLIFRSRRVKNKDTLIFMTCFLFSLCTVRFALDFNNVYDGLLIHPRPISEETKLLEGADALFYITDFTAEVVLIYRCWLVWGRDYSVTIFPFLMALGALGCGMASIGLLNKIDATSHQAPAAIVPLGTSGFALSLGCNFLLTALIVGRIWYMDRQMNRAMPDKDSSLPKAMSIMIESGTLVLVVQLILLVLFAIRHPAQAIMVPAATQIYGIAPTMIIVRSGLGTTFEPTAPEQSSIRFMSFIRKTQHTSGATDSTDVTDSTKPSEWELSVHSGMGQSASFLRNDVDGKPDFDRV